MHIFDFMRNLNFHSASFSIPFLNRKIQSKQVDIPLRSITEVILALFKFLDWHQKAIRSFLKVIVNDWTIFERIFCHFPERNLIWFLELASSRQRVGVYGLRWHLFRQEGCWRWYFSGAWCFKWHVISVGVSFKSLTDGHLFWGEGWIFRYNLTQGFPGFFRGFPLWRNQLSRWFQFIVTWESEFDLRIVVNSYSIELEDDEIFV